MHVVITGGTGLIGGALAEALAADGREVTVLTRDPARASALPPTARAAAWDARSIEPLLPYVAAADAIVHLAGENIAGEPGDRVWVTGVLRDHWGSTDVVSRGRLHHADQLPGFIATGTRGRTSEWSRIPSTEPSAR